MDEKPVNVLLIEDNPGDARLIREFLNDAGADAYDVECVELLSAGLERLAGGGIDVVLLDLQLPDSLGLDTLSRVHDQAPDVPIVVFTVLGDKDLAIKAMQGGAQDYLVKDEVDGKTLERSIRYAIERKRSEQMLRESEERLRNLFETMGEGVIMIAPDGGIVQSNPAASRILRLTRSELEDRNYFSSELKFINTDGTPLPPEEMAAARAIKTKRPVKNVVMGVERPDGTTCWINVNASPIIDEAGWLEGVVGTFTDITESRWAGDALWQSEEKLRSLVQNIPDVIIFLQRDGTILSVNSAMPGSPAHEAIGKKVYDYMAPEYFDGVKKAIGRVFETGTLESFQLLGVGPKGPDSAWYEVRAVPIMKKDVVIGITFICSDITERRQAEDELRKSEAKYRRLFESNKDGIVFTDMEGKFHDANQAFLDMLGYEMEELRGLSYHQITPEKWHEMEADLVKSQIIARGYSDEYKKEYIKKDGTVFSIEIRVWLINDKLGDPLGMWGIVRDISERKRAEEEKDRLLTQLFQSQKMESIGLLAGGMAHDFNNVLSNIQAKSYRALRRLPEDDPAREDLDEIRNICFTAGSLTRKLMQVGWEQPVELNPIDLNGGILEILGLLDQLVGREFSIVRELAEDLWTVTADKTCIEQIIMNLVLNAKDAMPEGGTISVKTRNIHMDGDYAKAHHRARPGEFVCLTVSDTGCGMDKETRSRIFEPFFSKKGPGKLFGVGLSVVYGIVKKHEGWIDVESLVGEGSKFRIFFPSIPEIPREEVAKIPSIEEYQGRGERIMIVEDEEPIRVLLEGILCENGYIVFPTKNAKEAIDLFTKEKGNFHLVFTDVFLPDESGVKLADRLRALTPRQRVLFGSGYLSNQSAEFKIIREKGYWLLEKPYDKLKLLRVTRKMLTHMPPDIEPTSTQVE